MLVGAILSKQTGQVNLRVFNWHKNLIDLVSLHEKIPSMIAIRPIELHKSINEIHVKEDGSFDEKPSIAFVCVDADTSLAVCEITLAALTEAFDLLGYELKPKTI